MFSKIGGTAFLLILLQATHGFAAACCGGGISLPALIQGDEKAQFSALYSNAQMQVDNVDGDGVWRNSGVPSQTQTLRIEYARIWGERAQWGVTVPVIQRERMKTRTSGLGDVALNLGYELLPDWDYNPLRPKALGYVQMVLPTGLARAESELGGLDSRGNGYLAVGGGVVVTKSFHNWDGMLTIEGHRSLPKQVSNTLFRGELRPGFGGFYGAGFGYNTKSFRYGVMMTENREDPVDLVGESRRDGLPERYATAVGSVTYYASDIWSASLAYGNQTILGSPQNTSLANSVSFNLQHRWAR